MWIKVTDYPSNVDYNNTCCDYINFEVIDVKYDVIIIGAGPAGLFSAYELITKNKKF